MSLPASLVYQLNLGRMRLECLNIELGHSIAVLLFQTRLVLSMKFQISRILILRQSTAVRNSDQWRGKLKMHLRYNG